MIRFHNGAFHGCFPGPAGVESELQSTLTFMENPHMEVGYSGPPQSYPGLFPCCKGAEVKFAFNFVECLCSPPKKCPHRQSCGSLYRCLHRNRHAIVEETLAEQGYELIGSGAL
jgi:hypothetical protein